MISQLTMSQGSFILPQEGAHWKEVWCNYWAGIFNGVYYVDNLQIKGDTAFNGYQYKKLYKDERVYKYAHLTTVSYDSLISTNERFFGGIRQDSQKVYVAAALYDTTMNEKLLFDFSAQEGDTVGIWLYLAGYQQFIIDSMYPVIVADGSSRKKYTLKETSAGTPLPLYWLEGIGSNYGLLSSHYIYMNDEVHYLRCLQHDTVKIYDVVPNYSNDCFATPLQNCDSSTAGIEERNGKMSVRFFPNPMRQNATLEFDNPQKENHTLTLYDSQGRLVRKITNITTNKLTIVTDNLSSGLYLFRLHSDGQVRANGILTIE